MGDHQHGLPGLVEAGVLLVLGALLILSAPRWPVRYASLVAVACALVLLFQFFWEIIILAVLLAGGYIMWENLNELRS